ncbi:unnamed protein product [Cylindrotheca closterium]|uniref:Uncharacterized protein n=1 Tax=Cylindrotheca closterium TaxID=2856 RepID=A0AAD2CTC4_9STRA|nr:unnamed protein product [Cylindrotheca closterium]
MEACMQRFCRPNIPNLEFYNKGHHAGFLQALNVVNWFWRPTTKRPQKHTCLCPIKKGWSPTKGSSVLETFQDGNQIAGVDDTKQGYLEEAFDQDYEPEDDEEDDVNLCGQFDDINHSKRDKLLETFQDGDQIAGVDETEQGYLEEAFDQDYEPEDDDERDVNLCGQFNDINHSKRDKLLADADNDVNDMPELTVRFRGDDDHESDDDN